jgi:hypothetical protein
VKIFKRQKIIPVLTCDEKHLYHTQFPPIYSISMKTLSILLIKKREKNNPDYWNSRERGLGHVHYGSWEQGVKMKVKLL